MKNFANTIFSTVVAVVLLGGCATVKLQSTWRDPGITPHGYAKLLVVGVSEDSNRRRTFEEILAGELRKRGVDAVISSDVMPAGKPEKEAVIAAVQSAGAEGVIVNRLISVEKLDEFMPEHAPQSFDEYYLGAIRYSPSQGLLTSTPATVPGHPVRVTTAKIESKLFDAATGKMVWAATSSTREADQVLKVFQGLSEIVAGKLRQEGFI